MCVCGGGGGQSEGMCGVWQQKRPGKAAGAQGRQLQGSLIAVAHWRCCCQPLLLRSPVTVARPPSLPTSPASLPASL